MFLAATGAALAIAGPIDKRAMATDWVYEVVTVTVTAGDEPGGVFVEQPKTKTKVLPSFTAPPPPPPEPTIVEPVPEPEPEPTQPPPVEQPKPTTKTKKPKPTTKPEPEPSPEPEPEPSPEPEPEPEEPQQPGLDEYAKTMLENHNIHRSNHSAPALQWDSTLAQYAKNTAEGCVFEHDMDQGAGGYGQNLATKGSTGDIDSAMLEYAASGVSMQWYNGEFAAWSYYGMDDPPASANFMEFGHFTQVLWKSTEKVGCHTSKCAAGTVLSMDAWYTVCNYDPPGNYAGEYGNNVLEPKGAAVFTV